MHEMSIATALVGPGCGPAGRLGGARHSEIKFGLGRPRGNSRSLPFSSASRDTLCEGARLNIDEVPLTVLCTYCDAVKTPAALYNFRCPDCGRPTPKVLTGREMQLVSIGLVPPETGMPATPRGARTEST